MFARSPLMKLHLRTFSVLKYKKKNVILSILMIFAQNGDKKKESGAHLYENHNWEHKTLLETHPNLIHQTPFHTPV